ncbi:MAG: hypothetical protein ACO3JL_04440 [Myxococcota bacterium]
MRPCSPVLLFSCLVVAASSTQTPAVAAPGVSTTAYRAILVLEEDFARFIAHRLDLSADGLPLRGEAAFVEVERAERTLEHLRLRYVALLTGDPNEEIRHLVLLRLAELHLDLGARIRRIPAPQSDVEGEGQRWAKRLTQRAVPLEGVGVGMLEQIARLPEGTASVQRFRNRAQLYAVLHAAEDGVLGPAQVATLRLELARDATYPAPRRLLEVRQVGRRAARW